MLATVNFRLESKAMEEEELLKSKFRNYRQQAETALKGLALTDVSSFPSLKGMVDQFLYSL